MATMLPRPEFSSTGYCLSQPGTADVVYLPEGGEVTVELSAASRQFHVEWIRPTEGTIAPGAAIAGGVKQSFTAPFKGPAVLLLSKLK